MTRRNQLGWWIDTHPLHLMGWGWALIVTALLGLGVLLGGSAQAQTAPAVTISLSPSTGTVPYNSTLTWSASGAASCSASGSWSGAKATSGSQQVAVTAAGQVYKLDCAGSVQQPTVTWTPATKNTDGSALTPIGHNLRESIDNASWTGTVSAAATASSYAWSGLSPGLHYFQVQTVGPGNALSAWTASVSTTIPTPLVGSGSVTAGTVSVPNPPTNVAVTLGTLAYELREYSGGTLRFVQVGTVPKGAPCPGGKLVGSFYTFGGATLTKPTQGGVIATKCG